MVDVGTRTNGEDLLRADAAGFDAFVSSHALPLLRTACLLTGDRPAAIELLRETLVQAAGRWRRVVASDDPLHRVRGVLLRTFLARSRARPDPGPDPGDVLATLSARQRALVVLSCHEALTTAQVGELLRTTPATVARRRTAALGLLRDRVDGGTDVDAAVRRELAALAGTVQPWRVTGPELRRAARERRRRRRRALGSAAAVVTGVALTAAVLDGPVARPDRPPVDRPTTLPVLREAQPEASWRSVRLTDDMFRRAVAAVGGGSALRPLVVSRPPGSDRVVVLLRGESSDGGMVVSAATFGSTRRDASVRSGTSGVYRSLSSLVAQPVRDGERTLLLVLLPPDVGDTVQVTSSAPGEAVTRSSSFTENRLAFVPVRAPDAVTRVRVLRAGRPVVDLIPAGSLLGPDVPRTLDRVVASADAGEGRAVQVRTDGRAACRLTAGRWWAGPPRGYWNPTDSACAPVEGALRLLLTDDPDATGVAGVAPPDAASVRLRWEDGSVSTVRTAGGDVNAFLGPVSRPASRLVRAEAVDPDGAVMSAVTP